MVHELFSTTAGDTDTAVTWRCTAAVPQSTPVKLDSHSCWDARFATKLAENVLCARRAEVTAVVYPAIQETSRGLFYRFAPRIDILHSQEGEKKQMQKATVTQLKAAAAPHSPILLLCTKMC